MKVTLRLPHKAEKRADEINVKVNMEGNRDMLPERKGGSQTNKSRNIHFVIGCCRLLPAAYLYSPVDPQQNHTNEHPPPAAIKKELRMNAHGLVYVYTASKSAGIEVGSFK